MKKLLSSIMIASMLFGMSGSVFAEDVNKVSSDSSVVTPTMVFDGPYPLKTTSYLEVAWEPNNWLTANVNVTNRSGNPGNIYFYIEDSKGKVYSTTEVAPGEMKTVNGIPSGGYHVYAKAKSKSGSYNLTIDDFPF